MRRSFAVLVSMCAFLFIISVASGCGATQMNLGGTKNTPSASAQQEVASAEKAPAMRRCVRKLGTATIVDKDFPKGYSALPYAREAVQDTGCFTLIATGDAADALFGSGAARQGSGADYALILEPVNSEDNAGGISGLFGTLIPPKVPMLGGGAAGVRKKVANVQLTLYRRGPNQTVVQVASVQGTANKWDFAGAIGGIGLFGIGGIGVGENTGEQRMLMNAVFHAVYLMTERL